MFLSRFLLRILEEGGEKRQTKKSSLRLLEARTVGALAGILSRSANRGCGERRGESPLPPIPKSPVVRGLARLRRRRRHGPGGI